MSESFEMFEPDYFTTGAIGAPGQRVFYLQGRQADTVVTLKVEKEQIAALADYLAGLLAKLPEAGTVSGDLPLLEPLEPAWAVGALGLGYDETADRLVVVANEVTDREEDDGEEQETPTAETVEGGEAGEGATARFLITRAQASAFVERARPPPRRTTHLPHVQPAQGSPGPHLPPEQWPRRSPRVAPSCFATAR